MIGRPRKTPPPPVARTVFLPAPSGVNRVDPIAELPPGDCVSMVNMTRSEYGPRSRLGYKDHATGLGAEVRSLLPFRGSRATEDRLFACTPTGIHDVTVATSVPTQVHAFALADNTSGRGVAHAVVTAAGHFLLYGDETNGLHVYTESTRTWAKIAQGTGAGQVAGIDPGLACFVGAWKNRVWLVERGTANAWYLDVGAIYGTATRFNFGTKFRSGGSLVGLWNWTIDGGQGIDDYLVAVSSAGDVAVYQGTDPASASTFSQRGVWSVGSVPSGRRIATQNGGDLLLLSALGLMPVSRLLSGAASVDIDAYETRKIAPIIGRLMSERQDQAGWEVRVHPEAKALVINTPLEGGSAKEQWVMSLAAKGWAQHLGVPMNCSESYGGRLYFGTVDGRVCANTGDLDAVGISDSTNAVDIEWSLLTSFQTFGSGNQKQLRMVQPLFQTLGSPPLYHVEARVDFDLSEPSGVPYSTEPAAGLWDVGLWDEMLWGDDTGTAGAWRGVSGKGSLVAVAMKGRSRGQVVLSGFKIAFTPGGAL